MILTADLIRTFASNAGFRGQDLDTAVAIARAESGGDPADYDPEKAFFVAHGFHPDMAFGRGSVGLWQIFRHEHPEFDGWNLEDPQVNACAAAMIFRRAGNRFEPWSTFTSGKYRQLLPVLAANPNPPGGAA